MALVMVRHDQRLSFALGYRDAWSKKDAKRDDEFYLEGYQEGEADRAVADSPSRRKKGARRQGIHPGGGGIIE